MSSPAKGQGSGESYSWRVTKEKNLLNVAQIERLAGLALLCLNTMNIDYKAAAHELGQASPNAVRTALFEIKKKLRDGGAVIGSAEPDSPTAPKSTGGRKRKSPDQEPAKEKAKKVKTSEAKVADSDQDDTV